jgi:hypothetical protein
VSGGGRVSTVSFVITLLTVPLVIRNIFLHFLFVPLVSQSAVPLFVLIPLLLLLCSTVFLSCDGSNISTYIPNFTG